MTKLKVYDIDPQAATDKQVPAMDILTGKVIWQDQTGGGGGGTGVRSKTAKTANVVYQAGANGGILVFSGELNGLALGYIVYSDASNPPTTVVGKSTLATNAYGLHDTTTVPILPNMYYTVTSNVTTVVCDFYEIGNNMAGGGTGIVPAFNLPLTDDTYTAGEDINADQHCVLTTYGPKLLVESDTVFTIGGMDVTFEYGQAFDWAISTTLDTLDLRLNTSGTNNNALSITAKVYAITGTYGTTAVRTGSALYTSDTLSNPSLPGGGTFTLHFTFGDAIPAGEYIVMFEGTHEILYNGYTFKGIGASAPYLGNVAAITTPTADKNLALVFNTATPAVMVSDASYAVLSDREGVATTSESAGASITLQKSGELAQTGALDDRALRYLSDTPGAISLTPGTNVRIIAQGTGTDKVWAGRDNLDPVVTVAVNTTYYSNTAGVLHGAYLTTGSTGERTSATMSTSLDNITRKIIDRRTVGFSTDGDGYCFLERIIPAGVFFKIECSTTGVFVSYLGTFRPIK